MKIDEEIKRFFLEFELRNKILPDNSLPQYLQKIQNNVLIFHDDLDKDMLVRILAQIRFEAGDDISNEVWEKMNLEIQDALDEIPYLAKISILKRYNDSSEQLINALIKVNSYRIEFAHLKIRRLLVKYNINTSQGKDNIQALIRALKRARDLFLSYAENNKVCSYYIKKQMEFLNKDKSNKN